MKALREHIGQQQAKFATHPFFARLDQELSIERAMQVAPHLTFWVMAFQDVLRLNEKLITDPFLKKVAHHHKAEDLGHERWFLTDIAQFQSQELDVRALFGPAHATTRDSAYALMSEVFRARADLLRIVLVLTLESSGHIFFERISRFVEAKGYTQRLKYFSDHHLKIEQAHAVFERKLEEELEAIVFSAEERAEALALVDRAYLAFGAMFDGLLADLGAAPFLPMVSGAGSLRPEQLS